MPLTLIIKKFKININYLFMLYAFCLPISKAGVSIFAGLILLYWLFSNNWKYKWLTYKNNLLSITILIFIGFSALSLTLFGYSDLSYALDYISKYWHFLIILVIYSLFDIKYLNKVLSVFLLGMFISEITSYGIFFQWWNYNNISSTDPAPFMNHTDYSAYLAFTSILLLLNAIYEKIIFKKLLYIIFFITVTANLFINGGRTGQVIFLVIIFISFIMSFKNKFKAIILAAIVLTSILITAYIISPNFTARMDYTKHEITKMIYDKNFDGAFARRVALWKVGIDKFSDNIFIGSGIGNEMQGIKQYAKKNSFNPDNFPTIPNSDHHNTFITIAVQQGLLGLMILIVIFYSIFNLHFKSLKIQILNYTFITTFFMWSMGGITFHTMDPMIFFAFFAGLFNKIARVDSLNEYLSHTYK